MSSTTSDVTEKELELTREDVLDIYQKELEKSHAKIEQLYHFIEMTEALTYDVKTALRIETFLKEEGIWPESQPKN